MLSAKPHKAKQKKKQSTTMCYAFIFRVLFLCSFVAIDDVYAMRLPRV